MTIPTGYKIERMPESPFVLETDFDKYQFSLVEKDNTLIYKRQLVMKAFKMPKERYTDYRAFAKKIAKMDKLKEVLVRF